MNLTFNFFKYKYPEKRSFRKLTAQELAWTQAHFPEDLHAFLEEDGYCSYGNGFFHFVNPADYTALLSEWKMVPEGHLVFCRTGVGDLITWDQNSVHILHVNQGTFSEISNDMFDFFKFSLGDERYVQKTLFKEQFDAASNRLGALNADECYAFVPALPLGGDEDAANLQKMPIAESLRLLNQLHS